MTILEMFAVVWCFGRIYS